MKKENFLSPHFVMLLQKPKAPHFFLSTLKRNWDINKNSLNTTIKKTNKKKLQGLPPESSVAV